MGLCAEEVNDAAMRANLKGQMVKMAGVAYVDTEALADTQSVSCATDYFGMCLCLRSIAILVALI
jgi:hypothetical protein